MYHYILKNYFQDSSNQAYLKSIDNDEGSFSFVDINISMKRRSLYYTFNYVLPSLMLTILSISGFLLPSDCGEKISLRMYMKIINTLVQWFFENKTMFYDALKDH